MKNLLVRLLRFRWGAYPSGHFYSPVVNPKKVAAHPLWPDNPETPGIDYHDDFHRKVLTEWFPRYIGEYDYPDESPGSDATLRHFYTRNSQYSWLDARLLFVFLRALQPRRIVEVGSGYSSLLMADVNHRFLQDAVELTCIEPWPRSFLREKIPGITQLVEAEVQSVPLSFFSALKPGDILFIDSSHVSKTGSDVNYLFLQVLPRLAPGVLVHIHDVFLPFEYPREWVLQDNRGWNEQYLVQALLMYSSGFRLLFGSSYAHYRFPEEVRAALALPGGRSFAGSSLWIERIDTGAE